MHKPNSQNPFSPKALPKAPAQASALDRDSLKLLQSGIDLQRGDKFLDAERVYQAILWRFPERALAVVYG